MIRDLDANYLKYLKEKQKLGLYYGMLAGLAFAVFTWGIDDFQLAMASADLPWLKFIIGGTFCLLVGGLIGWLTMRLDRVLVGLVGWLAAGVSFAWVSSHLPFEVTSKVIEILDPRFKGLLLYPYPDNVNYRMVIIYMTTLIAFGLVGVLQTILVEAASEAISVFMRWVILCLCIPLMAFAGSSADNINQPLRGPIMAVDGAIRFVLNNEGKNIDRKDAIVNYASSVDPLGAVLHRPRRIILGRYDTDTLDSFSVYINFNGDWAFCSATVNQLTFCQLSQDNYPPKLACLLAGKQGQPSCTIDTTPTAEQWIAQVKDQIGPDPKATVEAQRGNFTLVAVQGQDNQQYECQFQGFQFSTVLDGCYSR